jgi:hypothetical protein
VPLVHVGTIVKRGLLVIRHMPFSVLKGMFVLKVQRLHINILVLMEHTMINLVKITVQSVNSVPLEGTVLEEMEMVVCCALEVITAPLVHVLLISILALLATLQKNKEEKKCLNARCAQLVTTVQLE